MADFQYVLELLEAKGWYLYQGIPHADLTQVISAGRARALRTSVYYHLMPAISYDTSAQEMRAAAAEAARLKAMPMYNDGVNRGPVLGIQIAGREFLFVSKATSFAFSADGRAEIEDAIKFNLSNYNTLFFDSIDAIGAFLDERKIAPQRPPVLPSQLRWTYVHRDDDPTFTAIWPENPGDVLFRGQSKRYIPCVSTATRGMGIDARYLNELTEAHQARLIANLIRTEWFVALLRETAAVKWLRESRVFVDEMALAQHYGLPTGYIDLTQSFEVASFFACCQYNPADRSWSPVAEGEGVIYTVEWRNLSLGNSIRPIHLQFFPRPSEQWGWTCEVGLGDDFDKLPFVRKLVFKHHAAPSRRILAKFSQGKDLFPPDPLSDLAEAINASPLLPMDAAERIARDIVGDPHGKPDSSVKEILTLVEEFASVKLSGEVGIPEMARIESQLADAFTRKRDSFFEGIGTRMVRVRKE
jgi:hypothetical protein